MTHETPEADDAAAADPGLSALVTLLHFQGVGADAGQLRHRFGGAAVGVTEMLRCARELGLKARTVKTSWPRLAATPLPGIAVMRDGGFLLLGRVGDDKAIIQDLTFAIAE